ncbi:MAG: 3-dehydroquinate synthase [Rhodothermales bacterium]
MPVSASVIQQTVQVTFRYPVAFTTRLFDRANPLLGEVIADEPGAVYPKRMVVVVDEGVADAHPDVLEEITRYIDAHAEVMYLATAPLVIPGGEAAKNDPALVAAIHEAVDTGGIDRHSYVMTVGGGAVLDMAGYAAATAHRGVRLIRVPTTVLAQDDSAVGVKNGINGFGKKNWLGSFAPPYAVLNDLHFLTTLDDRDWLGGVSEAVKVALLKDPAFFEQLEALAPALVARDLEAMAPVVRRCAELHLEHIATSGDAFEMGSSRPLDFGHWAAHKLEQLTHYEVRHGEAVAIGIALDSTYSFLAGHLAEADWRRVIQLFADLNLAVFHPRLAAHLDDPAQSVVGGLREFREHLGGRLTIMLLHGIGHGFEVHEMDEALIRQSIERLASLAATLAS